jgi:hypothetical protein
VDSQTGRTVFSKPVDGPDWVALSADGTRVVTGGGSVEPLSMWDVGSGRLLAQFDTTQAFWFGFSHDERTVSLSRSRLGRLSGLVPVLFACDSARGLSRTSFDGDRVRWVTPSLR